ncbi:MAG: glycoside hydrolase [Fibrobacter sp.]|nr:glycoside hydrolase [Fibrobacter sp.]
MAKTTTTKATKPAAKPAAEKKAPAAKKAAPKAAAAKKPAAKPAAAKKAVAKPAPAKKACAEFVADCPLATTVSVAGSFNNWAVDKTMLKKDKKTGLWFVKISLPAGDYEYKFVCDGKNWDAGDNKIKHV